MESKGRVTREGYMRSLSERLRKLPKEDREMALEYFREYFDEAGPENEAEAIENLGTPQQAAEQIIMNLAVKNCEEAPRAGVKRNFRAVWIGILAVFAAPIAVPLAFAAVLTLGALGLSLVAVLASLVVAAAALVGGSLCGVILGAIMLLKSPANAVATMGVGFLGMGLGLLLCPLAVNLTKGCLSGLIRIFGNMVRRFTKGGRKYEQEQ